MTRNRAIILAVLAIAALLWWWPRSSSTTRTVIEPTAPKAPPTEPTYASMPELGQDDGPKPKVGMWMTEDPELPLLVAKRLELTQYPPDARTLEMGQADLLEPNRRWENRGAVKHKDRTRAKHHGILFTGDKWKLHGDDTFNARFVVDRDGKPQPVEIVRAVVQAVDYETRQPLGLDLDLRFRKDADHTYRASFTPADGVLAEHEGWLDVELEFDYGGDKLGFEKIEIYYAPASLSPAEFTGEIREELRDGSLYVLVGVDVKIPGRYIVDANFFDSAARPISAPRGRLTLESGLQWVPLQLYGKLLHDTKAQLPLTMTNLRGYLFRPGVAPGKRHMRDHGEVYTTGDYPMDRFTAEEYWSEDKQRMIESMLADAKRTGKTSYQKTVGDAEK